jgi:hypothetical protein
MFAWIVTKTECRLVLVSMWMPVAALLAHWAGVLRHIPF